MNWKCSSLFVWAIGVAVLGHVTPARGDVQPLVIAPSDDGDIRSTLVVRTTFYVSPDGADGQGIVEFPMPSLNGPIQQATLAMELYGWPPQSLVVHVYGYASNDGVLTTADYNAGVYIGDLTMSFQSDPQGFERAFDVTEFLKTVNTPYVGFNLRTDHGLVLFSSLENNYDHPSLLSVTVPEPTACFALASAAGLFLGRRGGTRR